MGTHTLGPTASREARGWAVGPPPQPSCRLNAGWVVSKKVCCKESKQANSEAIIHDSDVQVQAAWRSPAMSLSALGSAPASPRGDRTDSRVAPTSTGGSKWQDPGSKIILLACLFPLRNFEQGATHISAHSRCLANPRQASANCTATQPSHRTAPKRRRSCSTTQMTRTPTQTPAQASRSTRSMRAASSTTNSAPNSIDVSQNTPLENAHTLILLSRGEVRQRQSLPTRG